MKKSVRVLGAAALCLLIPETAWPSVEASVTARDENSFDLEGDWDGDFVNLGVLDCAEDIEITVTISVSGEDTSGREIYLFSGDDCDDPDDESDECGDDILEYDADTGTVDLPVSWLLDEADCSGDVSTGLWVGLLESEGDKEDGATWAERIDIDLETSVPDAPEEVTVGVGESNLLVGWERLDEDVGAYAVVWALASEDEVDGGQCEGPLEEGMELDGGMWWKEVGASASDARIGNLTNGSVYQVAVVTVAESGNPSLLSEVLCAVPEETVNFFEAYEDAGGSGGGEYCFIATGAYGDYDHPVVRVLRRFRDRVLYRIPGGEVIVAAYYRLGPIAVRMIGDREDVWRGMRVLLSCLAGGISGAAKIGIFTIICCLIAAALAGIALGAWLPGESDGEWDNDSRG